MSCYDDDLYLRKFLLHAFNIRTTKDNWLTSIAKIYSHKDGKYYVYRSRNGVDYIKIRKVNDEFEILEGTDKFIQIAEEISDVD
jgi:hypothetical protein